MSAINKHGRQWMLHALVDMLFSDAIAASTFTITLPPGALLDTLTVDTTTAYDSATSAALTVTDGTTVFVNGVDVKTAGRETVANIGKYYANGGTLTISVAYVGAPTVGENFITAGYLVNGRTNEVQV